MASPSLPGPDRPYVAAPFLGILVTVPVQLISGTLGLAAAQTVVVVGLVGAAFGTRYAGATVSAASLSASLAAGGAVIVLIVAGSL